MTIFQTFPSMMRFSVILIRECPPNWMCYKQATWVEYHFSTMLNIPGTKLWIDTKLYLREAKAKCKTMLNIPVIKLWIDIKLYLREAKAKCKTMPTVKLLPFQKFGTPHFWVWKWFWAVFVPNYHQNPAILQWKCHKVNWFENLISCLKSSVSVFLAGPVLLVTDCSADSSQFISALKWKISGNSHFVDTKRPFDQLALTRKLTFYLFLFLESLDFTTQAPGETSPYQSHYGPPKEDHLDFNLFLSQGYRESNFIGYFKKAPILKLSPTFFVTSLIALLWIHN